VRVFCKKKLILIYLHIWKSPQSTKEGHCLTTARRATQYKRFVFRKPSVKKRLVTNSVNSWNNNVWRGNFVSFYFNLWYLRLPQDPFTLNSHLKNRNGTMKLCICKSLVFQIETQGVAELTFWLCCSSLH